MRMLEKILVTIDFLHENNESLINTATYLAGIFNSEITVLNVLPQNSEDNEVKNFFRKFAEENLKILKEQFDSKGINYINTLVLTGNPFDKILETAEKEDYNVILAGPGNQSSDTNKLGVTIRKLIRKTSMPVWVIKPDTEQIIKRIFCPVDFSEASKRALSNAVLLASKMNAELRVVSVYEPIEIVSRRISADLDDYNQKSLASYKLQFEEFLKEIEFHKVQLSSEVLVGVPDKIILEEINTGKYDLLLMGTTGRSGISRILVGSVTEKVIEDCPVSFITTKNRNFLNPEYELKITNLESLLQEASECMVKGEYERASLLYEKAMIKDDLLIPALLGAAIAQEKLMNKKKADIYREHAREILKRLYTDDSVKELLNNMMKS